MPRPVLAAVSLCALLVAAPASAHVEVTPAFLAAESAGKVELRGPNERDEPMTGFAVTVPGGFAIARALPSPGWDAAVEGRAASWSGGSLAPGAEATFGFELEAPDTPGTVRLDVEQRYSDGAVTRWQVSFTVTPASEANTQNLGAAALVALLGLVVAAAAALLLLRRRTEPLQEK